MHRKNRITGIFGMIIIILCAVTQLAGDEIKLTTLAPTSYWMDTGDGTDNIYNTNSGNVGIGTGNPWAKLHVVETREDPIPDDGSGIMAMRVDYNTTSSGGLRYGLASLVTAIEGGSTDGYITGEKIVATTQGSGNTINSVMGEFIAHGVNYGSPTITDTKGILILRYRRPGTSATITNSYDLYIADGYDDTAGTLQNKWAIYQAEPDAKNYFAGNVGIGRAMPGWAFTVDKSVDNDAVAVIRNGSLSGYGLAIRAGDPASGRYALHIQDYTGTNTIAGFFANGNVGIGTTTPAGSLVVNGGSADGEVFFQNNNTGVTANDGFYCGIGTEGKNAYLWNYENGPLYLATNNTTRMYISDTGNVGIGTPTPTGKLHIKAPKKTWTCGIRLEDAESTNYYDILFDDRLRIGYNSSTRLWLNSSGDLWIAGTLSQGSSRELKKDINYLSKNDYREILGKIESARVVTYRRKEETSGNKFHIGVIAEEAPEEIVSEDRKSINTSDYLSFLLAAVKAQQHQIAQLETEIEALKKNRDETSTEPKGNLS